MILDQAQMGQILVAREGGCVLGMVNLLYTVSTALGGRVAWLEDVIVLPRLRGRGVGRALVQAALDHAQACGCRRVTLLTDADNGRAQHLYRSLGLVPSAMQVMRLLCRDD